MIVRIGFSKPIALLIHIAALLPIAIYAAHHLLQENAIIGVMLSISGIVLLYSTYAVSKDSENDIILQIFVISISITLVAVCYYLGIRGAIYVFPLLSAYFYAFPYRYALILSCVAATLCMVASLNSLESITVARLSIGLGLSVFFNASFAYLVKKQKTSLTKEAMEDYLTGILNRRSFNKWLNKEIPAALRRKNLFAILYIDLDNFKRINDNYGHHIGDLVLIETVKRMQHTIRAGDKLFSLDNSNNVARLAGDEFSLVLSNIESVENIKTVIQRLIDSLGKTYHIRNLALNINASIGIAIAGKDGTTADELIKNADAAMYQAKNDGKKRYQFFNKTIANQINEYIIIEKGLQAALTNESFYLMCMPIYYTGTLDIAGVEVLIRCDSENLSDYGPDKYIPIAERCGFIYDIDILVIDKTLQHIADLKQTYVVDNMFFSINLSAKELLNRDIVDKIEALLLKYDISPQQIVLEITETSLVGHGEKSISTLRKLKSIGISLVLDDFGTGYTAFNQLVNYPIDTLKIDRTFINNLETIHKKSKSMVSIISSLANLYELDTVAEGVETRYQLDYVRKLGCQYVQGYYLSEPISWEELSKKIPKHH